MTEIYFNATATVTEQRTIQGLACPYNVVTQDGRNVRFAAGAFGNVEDLALAAVLIQHPFADGSKAVRIGRVESWEDSEAGLMFSARISESDAAEPIYQALKDGSVTDVSVGVYVNEFTEDDNGITTFSSAEILELSVITEGKAAFADSKILSVFAEETEQVSATSLPTQTSKEIPAMEETNTEVADLREEMNEISRSLAVFAESNRPEQNTESRFKTFGSIVKAIAAGDESAKAEYMAYTGGTSADTATQRPGWANDVRKFVEARRPIQDAFRTEPLPEEGMEVSYFIDGTDTTQVTQQVAEGNDLAFGKITLSHADAPIKTYGGYVEWTAQQIERSPISVIEEGYRALARRYAQVTENATRTLFLGSTSPSVTGFNATSYNTVVDTVVDGATKLDDAGYAMEFIVVSPGTYKKLAKLQVGTSGAYILNRNDGSLNIPGVSGDLFNVPLLLLPGAAGDLFVMSNSDAITTWEDPGAPHRLQDSNVVNLSQQFSLYGWLAQAVTAPNALVKGVA